MCQAFLFHSAQAPWGDAPVHPQANVGTASHNQADLVPTESQLPPIYIECLTPSHNISLFTVMVTLCQKKWQINRLNFFSNTAWVCFPQLMVLLHLHTFLKKKITQTTSRQEICHAREWMTGHPPLYQDLMTAERGFPSVKPHWSEICFSHSFSSALFFLSSCFSSLSKLHW